MLSYQPIQLLDYQVAHYNNLCTILRGYQIARDTSPTGTGKTYVSLKISADFITPIFLVAPGKQIIVQWQDVQQKHLGIPQFIDAITYKGLAPREPKDFGTIEYKYIAITKTQNGESHSFNYSVTQEMTNIIKQGAILIFDESHTVKNSSAIVSKCVIQIISELMKLTEQGYTRSRAILLSASPIDKEQQMITLYKELGIITRNAIYTSNPIVGYKEGYFQEILQFAYRITTRRTEFAAIIADYPLLKSNAGITLPGFSYTIDPSFQYNGYTKPKKKIIQRMAFDILSDVVIPVLTSSMPGMTRNVYRAFMYLDYDGTDTNAKKYANAIRILANELRPQNPDEEINKNASFGVISECLGDMEDAIVDAVCHFDLFRLARNPEFAIVAAFNRLSSIERYVEFFRERGYNVMQLTGKVNIDDRSRIQEKFNEPRDSNILAMTAKTGGTGINLHDIHGGHNRILTVPADYSSQVLSQTTGRVNRGGQKSEPEAYVIFGIGDDGILANSLLEALQRKASVTTKAISDTVSTYRLQPGDYPRFVQGVGYINEQYYYDPTKGYLSTQIMFQLIKSQQIQLVDGPISQDDVLIMIPENM